MFLIFFWFHFQIIFICNGLLRKGEEMLPIHYVFCWNFELEPVLFILLINFVICKCFFIFLLDKGYLHVMVEICIFLIWWETMNWLLCFTLHMCTHVYWYWTHTGRSNSFQLLLAMLVTPYAIWPKKRGPYAIWFWNSSVRLKVHFFYVLTSYFDEKKTLNFPVG